MNLYLVELTENIEYDEFNAFVIRAEDENQAREIASKKASSNDDPSEEIKAYFDKIWFDPSTECKLIEMRGESEVVLGSFLHG